MSLLFAFAAHKTKEMRAAWLDYLEMAYANAETACNGVLLNNLGRAEGNISSFEVLFKGKAETAFKYASWELCEYWETTPRMTKVQFERMWMDSQGIIF